MKKYGVLWSLSAITKLELNTLILPKISKISMINITASISLCQNRNSGRPIVAPFLSLTSFSSFKVNYLTSSLLLNFRKAYLTTVYLFTQTTELALILSHDIIWTIFSMKVIGNILYQ